MTHYKGNTVRQSGLRGPDKQQEGLRDERHGTYDAVTSPLREKPLEQRPTRHESEQGGADVRAESAPLDPSMPEGLRRPLKGPMSPVRGRKGES
jgi:hypothetical protein